MVRIDEGFFGTNKIGVLLFGYIQEDINVNSKRPSLMSSENSQPKIF